MRTWAPTFLTALACALLLLPAAADAKLPTYRTPGYRGVTRVPRTRPTPGLAAAPVALSPAGIFPDVHVDAAGTSHIVWNEDDGGNADVLRYCRLRRGATTCDNPAATQRLVPAKEYGPGDDPAFNVDQSGPRVLAIGNQLILLSYRYPTGWEKPDGSDPSRTLLAWVSDDGGNSFTGPAIVGDAEINGGVVAFGAENDPTILAIDQTSACGSCVQAIRPGAFTSAKAALGAPSANQAYYGSLAVDGGLPVAAFADLNRTSVVRRWSGTGSPGDAATWGPPQTIPGDEPKLASGPSGLFMLNQPRFAGAWSVRRLAGSAVGSPTTISDTDDAVLPDLFQDPGGRLFAAWESRGGDEPGVRLRSSVGGGSWTPAALLARGTGNGQLALGATTDGGGVLAFNSSGGINQIGPIAAIPLGPRTPTGLPGLGNIPGGGDPNARSGCREITFGAVKIKTADEFSCFFKGTGRDANVSVSNGEVDFNGLKIAPDEGTRILIDAARHTLDTTGPVRALVRGASVGEIVLWHGPLHVELPTAASGVPFSFPMNQFHADLKGFGIVGKIDVFLTPQGVRIPVSLKLPPYLGGVTGSAELVADSKTGLHLNSLVIDVKEAPIGPLLIRGLHIEYRGDAERWDGAASLLFPPPGAGAQIDAKVVFVGGDFESGEVVVTPPFPPGIAVGPGVFLSKIGGAVRLNPLELSLIGQFGAVPLTPRGPFTATVDGRATVSFGDPITFTFDGTGSILDIALAQEHFVVNTDGYASLTAGTRFDLGIVSGEGNGEATIDGPRGQFLVDINGNIEIAGQSFGGVEALASSEGLAGCYELLIASLGFGYRWGDSLPSVMFPSCDLSSYKPVPGAPPAGSPALTAGSSFDVRAGTPAVSIQVDGDGGLPQVVLVDPDGERISPLLLQGAGSLPTDPEIISLLRVMALPVSPTRVTIGIVKPKAGTWKIEPAAGAARASGAGGGARGSGSRPVARAAAISGLQIATGLPAPTVSARLSGRGRQRTLTYNATQRAGLTVTFVERGRGGTRTLVASRAGGRGRVTFSTGNLPGGRRTVIAVVQQDDAPRLQRVVASYVAPAPPRPARVSGVTVKRAGGAVVVRWRRASAATGYLVRVTIGDGRRLARVLGAGARSLRIPRVAARYAASATVAGRTNAGKLGPAGRAVSRAAAQRRAARARKTRGRRGR
ncbi:hypothetical protein [Conexibacter sp. CPCC 206217]|uniref:hypothetical protein n=1 Tax=Conexibacter sp. CPCC 206217 TaxID=3064574 RepID=UPI00271BB64A|nr:hypothetical protein [Conexibacter sp. CPCC 206217]MDO8210842.1 hypothetical protein [Conexibacter sp. CPCC 206217]